MTNNDGKSRYFCSRDFDLYRETRTPDGGYERKTLHNSKPYAAIQTFEDKQRKRRIEQAVWCAVLIGVTAAFGYWFVTGLKGL